MPTDIRVFSKTRDFVPDYGPIKPITVSARSGYVALKVDGVEYLVSFAELQKSINAAWLEEAKISSPELFTASVPPPEKSS